MTQAATETTEPVTVWAADLLHDVRTDVSPREAFADEHIKLPVGIRLHADPLQDETVRPWGRAEPNEPPGMALHRALCRAARVRPTSPGAFVGAADLLGLTRAAYHRIVRHGSLGRVADLARSCGLSVLSRGGATVVGP